LLNILYSVVKEQTYSSREPCTIRCAQKRVKGPFYQTMAGYSLEPHALTALSHAVNRQEAQARSNRPEDNKASDGSQVHLRV
jgi:hypothetical protein